MRRHRLKQIRVIIPRLGLRLLGLRLLGLRQLGLQLLGIWQLRIRKLGVGNLGVHLRLLRRLDGLDRRSLVMRRGWFGLLWAGCTGGWLVFKGMLLHSLGIILSL